MQFTNEQFTNDIKFNRRLLELCEESIKKSEEFYHQILNDLTTIVKPMLDEQTRLYNKLMTEHQNNKVQQITDDISELDDFQLFVLTIDDEPQTLKMSRDIVKRLQTRIKEDEKNMEKCQVDIQNKQEEIAELKRKLPPRKSDYRRNTTEQA